MVSFSVVATLIASVSALGINCRGSGSCPLNEGASLTTIITQMKQLIVAGKGNQWYNAGEQIVCSGGRYGSNCAFFQKTGGNLNLALAKAQDLYKHGCRGCGSCPTKPGNNVNTGMLTVNFVSAPCCKDDCACPL